MSEDAILDALDAMVTGFKRQTPDEWSPSGHLETRVTKKNPVFLRHWILWALWAPKIRLYTGEIEKTIIVITTTTHLLLFFLKGRASPL
jgi:hypothetical protein